MKKFVFLECLAGLLFAMLLLNPVCAGDVRYARPDPAIPLGESAPVQAFIEEMVAKHGFNRATLRRTFSQISYSEAAVGPFMPKDEESDQLVAAQPKDWREYRARFVTPGRIRVGEEFWNRYAKTLARAEAEYGVAQEIIVGIIGVETRYGRNTGQHRVLDTLTTLAFDYPDTPNSIKRMTFFRKELVHALLYARESAIDPLSLTGSYAGAIGWPQFMPSSIRSYAVDFDRNGRIDLIHSPQDAIGSVANYLASHGWLREKPIVFPARLESVSAQRLEALISAGLQASFLLDDLQSIGITAKEATPTDIRFGLVDMEHGFEPIQYWLATNNFFAITKYNRSYFYAMAVVDLGREVRLKREAGTDEDDY